MDINNTLQADVYLDVKSFSAVDHCEEQDLVVPNLRDISTLQKTYRLPNGYFFR
jgi:hypothetical protein